MQFDFTTVYDRHGHDSQVVDFADDLNPYVMYHSELREGFDLIPMWAADMNFATAPAVMEAVRKRLEHPILGYFQPSEAYFDSILRWHHTRNGFTQLKKEHIGFERNVLCGIDTALRAFTKPGGCVLMNSPVYVGFLNILEHRGFRPVFSPMKKDENGVYRMDLADMEEKIQENDIHTFLFCSPHNPTGRVWERGELEELLQLCSSYDVNIICDEIWSDLTRPEKQHIPLLSVNAEAGKRVITFLSITKTFNLGGTIGSYYLCFDEALRSRYEACAAGSYYNDMDVLSMHMLIGGYSPEGEAWLDELRQVLAQNIDYTCAYIRSHFPGVEVTKPESTFLLFLDCSKWCAQHGVPFSELLASALRVGVVWYNGEDFMTPKSIRLNVALPMSRLQEALERLDRFVFNA